MLMHNGTQITEKIVIMKRKKKFLGILFGQERNGEMFGFVKGLFVGYYFI
jgi:hypothetical protein